ncbi:MAG: hypothetical protein ACHP9Z_00980 [Streptosporangiales bacterium]
MTQIKDPDGLDVMLRGWLSRSPEQAGEWRTLGLLPPTTPTGSSSPWLRCH